MNAIVNTVTAMVEFPGSKKKGVQLLGDAQLAD